MIVYAVIPRESLDEIRRKQAIRRATSIVRSVSSSMELEARAVSAADKQNQIETLANELLAKSNSGFWDEI